MTKHEEDLREYCRKVNIEFNEEMLKKYLIAPDGLPIRYVISDGTEIKGLERRPQLEQK